MYRMNRRASAWSAQSAKGGRRMKMNKIFSINTILRLAAGAILAAALFGCANMGESPALSAGVTGGAGVGGGAGAGSLL